MNFLALPFSNSDLGYIVQSDGKASVTGDVPMYSDASGLLLADSGFKMTDKLSLDGSLPMTGALDMAGSDVTNTGTVRPRDDAAVDVGESAKRFRSMYASNATLNALDMAAGAISNVNLFYAAGSGRLIVVTNTVVNDFATATPGNIAMFSADGDGLHIQDGVKQVNDIVTNANTGGAAGNLVIFTDSSSKRVGDCGIAYPSIARCIFAQTNTNTVGGGAVVDFFPVAITGSPVIPGPLITTGTTVRIYTQLFCYFAPGVGTLLVTLRVNGSDVTASTITSTGYQNLTVEHVLQAQSGSFIVSSKLSIDSNIVTTRGSVLYDIFSDNTISTVGLFADAGSTGQFDICDINVHY